MTNQLDVRLHALKGVDAVIAALQTTFENPRLLGLDETYRYTGDPQTSNVWICATGGREGFERGMNKMLVTVSRGEFQPLDMHFQNRGQSESFSGISNFSDMCHTPVFISCEAGNFVQSEILASVVYQVLKFFRQDLMTQFDIFQISVQGISAPNQLNGTAGSPWITTVTVKLQTQEMFQLTELSNNLNTLNIVSRVKQNAKMLVNENIVMS